MDNASPWIKLIALSIVGGVAKSLFGTPPTTNYYTKTLETAKDVAETVSGS